MTETDSETSFRHAIDVADKNGIAHINLGVALGAGGPTSEAIEQYQAALRGNPNFAIAYSDLGLALLHQGRPSDSPGASANRGLALLKSGRTHLDQKGGRIWLHLSLNSLS